MARGLCRQSPRLQTLFPIPLFSLVSDPVLQLHLSDEPFISLDTIHTKVA
jgi:hypothetical protein